jgi:cytochrome c-type biogenesis protein CcmH
MNTSTDWLPALAILGAGLIVGLLFVVVIRRRKGAAGASPAEDIRQPRRLALQWKGFVSGVACTLAVGGIAYFAIAKSEAKPKVDVEQRIALAKDSLAKNDLMGTFEQTKAVLATNPNDARALTYNAVVLMAMGQADEAKAMLESATQHDPAFLDAWVALASLHTQAGNDKAAATAIDAAIARHPAEEARLREVLAQMRSQRAAPQATPSDLPPDHPPLRTAGAETTASAKPIRITLSLGNSALSKSGVVYVIARAEGASGGHPVAVKRIDATSFPLSVDLGGADSMMGQPLPATVRIEARLDSDGDAGTVEAGDPKAFVDGVSPGAALMLKLE